MAKLNLLGNLLLVLGLLLFGVQVALLFHGEYATVTALVVPLTFVVLLGVVLRSHREDLAVAQRSPSPPPLPAVSETGEEHCDDYPEIPPPPIVPMRALPRSEIQMLRGECNLEHFDRIAVEGTSADSFRILHAAGGRTKKETRRVTAPTVDGRWDSVLAGLNPGVYTIQHINQKLTRSSMTVRLETPFKLEV